MTETTELLTRLYNAVTDNNKTTEEIIKDFKVDKNIVFADKHNKQIDVDDYYRLRDLCHKTQ